jgi:hypothetical protein
MARSAQGSGAAARYVSDTERADVLVNFRVQELDGVGAVHGVRPQIAYCWFRSGMLPVPGGRVNEWMVLVNPGAMVSPVAGAGCTGDVVA